MSRIALAQITRSLNDPGPAQRFLKNAQDHGHEVERLIVAYSHGVDQQAVRALRQMTRLDLVLAGGDIGLSLRLSEAGLTEHEVHSLLEVPSWGAWNEVPYGAYRNAALFTALLEGIDYLIFFDSDVWPRELSAIEDGEAIWNQIDFVGEHLAALSIPGVIATSSEYSGFYIIPPMGFDGLDELLIGLEKASDAKGLARIAKRSSLKLADPGDLRTEPTEKLLGGNLGLNLGNPEQLLPFFSAGYEFRGKFVLGRGEDTFLSQGLSAHGSRMIDIKLPIFHDTFVDFPSRPRIQTSEVLERFYRACLGWIGRNPPLAWRKAELGTLETSLEVELERQRRGLQLGGGKAARYLTDDRFGSLEEALESSVAALPRAIARYQSLIRGWTALQRALRIRSYDLENPGVELV